MSAFEGATYSHIIKIKNTVISEIITMSMESDAILSVQHLQHREVAELRWDGATELI